MRITDKPWIMYSIHNEFILLVIFIFQKAGVFSFVRSYGALSALVTTTWKL